MLRINHPYIKGASAWLEKRPYVAALLVVVAFILKDLPQWLASVWSLRSSKPLLLSITEVTVDVLINDKMKPS